MADDPRIAKLIAGDPETLTWLNDRDGNLTERLTTGGGIVRMLMRSDLYHEAIVTKARDDMREAAAEIARLRAEAAKWRKAFDLKSAVGDRYLPCPDHRDKVDARVTGCIVCRAERAENEAARLRARPTWREGVEAAAAWHDGQAAQYDAAASKAAGSGIMDFCLREAESHRKCAVAIRSMKEPGHAG